MVVGFAALHASVGLGCRVCSFARGVGLGYRLIKQLCTPGLPQIVVYVAVHMGVDLDVDSCAAFFTAV